MNVNEALSALVEYAVQRGLIEEVDRIWALNRLLDALKLDSWEPGDPAAASDDLEAILAVLLDDAVARGVIEDTVVHRDLLDTELMGRLTPRPSWVISKFENLYAQSPATATDWFYEFNQDIDYIRRYRIARDMKWLAPTEYGELDITINLSKPEKDPKAIAAAKLAPQGGYPKCLLCCENQGYAGRLNHPARQNLRTIPVTIDGLQWYFQYSPYVYYNEHCIVFNGQHVPMRVTRSTFAKLLDFVQQFPEYFVGSNADLPIVGGSILSHDHFQGGRFEFAMAKAPIETPVQFAGYDTVDAGIVKWPMSVIRLRCEEIPTLVDLADKILDAWRGYTDEDAFIFAETEGEPHNTITPIARFRDGKYELDLVLRNNITTEEHPMGVYHPHEEMHHIKKENIGLIEVMGLAVLPARLKTELADLAELMAAEADAAAIVANIRADEVLEKHADWAAELLERYTFTPENALEILQAEVGKTFAAILGNAGVYKRTPEGQAAFLRFVDYVNQN